MFKAMLIILVVSLIVGIVGGFIFVVLGCIYVIPYAWWSADRKNKNLYGEALSNPSGFKQLKNATILYKHWITKNELTF